jgi:hypothetical protein
MVNAASFIEKKSRQLSFYADALVWGSLPESEVDLYFWDTLEEWSQISTGDYRMTAKESAFWHLFHQLVYSSLQDIKGCPKLRTELDLCIEYLQGEGTFPEFCSGIRP